MFAFGGGAPDFTGIGGGGHPPGMAIGIPGIGGKPGAPGMPGMPQGPPGIPQPRPGAGGGPPIGGMGNPIGPGPPGPVPNLGGIILGGPSGFKDMMAWQTNAKYSLGAWHESFDLGQFDLNRWATSSYVVASSTMPPNIQLSYILHLEVHNWT